MTFEVVPVTVDMADEVGRIHADSWQAAYRGIIPSEYLATVTPASRAERIRRVQAHYAAAERYLFRVDGTGAGLAAIHASGDEDSTEGCGEVGAIYFLPEYWGQGYGRRAMDFCLNRLAALGFNRARIWVLEDNARARRFYEKYGFALDGARKKIELSKPLIEVRYEKRIDH